MKLFSVVVDVQSSVAYKVSAIESMLSVDAGVVMYSNYLSVSNFQSRKPLVFRRPRISSLSGLMSPF